MEVARAGGRSMHEPVQEDQHAEALHEAARTGGVPLPQAHGAGSAACSSGQQGAAGERRRHVSAVEGFKFEYLDHTADVQLHAWGVTLQEAFAQAGLAMFNYMTPLAAIHEGVTRPYRAEGHDLQSLLFSFLDELLFAFHTELMVCSRIDITRFDRGASFVIEAVGHGEVFDRSRHEGGTEVKAITFSAMSIREEAFKDGAAAEVFVIVDI